MARLRTLFHEDSVMTHARSKSYGADMHGRENIMIRLNATDDNPIRSTSAPVLCVCDNQVTGRLSGFYFNLSVSVFRVPSPRRTSGVRSILGIGAKG